MAAEENNLPQKTRNFWKLQKDGREITHSPEIIAHTLTWLKRKQLLTLFHRGYQSGSTILIDYTPSELEIDKPADWPARETRIWVLFKDAARIWNYFATEVQPSGNSLLGRIPRSICRLQRRAHFRVEAPRGSQASFRHQGAAYSLLQIKDLSASGMQLHSKTRLTLACKDVITDISISIPEGSALFQPEELGELIISIRKGRIVRAEMEENMFCYGIDFECARNEEKVLLRYVRQRELVLLRKGLSG
jgi:c-di-GMP-binding flagellar brake protein YcgR